MKSKTELRAQLIAKRRSLSRTETEKKSQAILSRFVASVDWAEINDIHCYRAASSEVQTEQFIEWVEDQGASVTIPDQKAAEPTKAELAKKYDMVVVPMLGFDIRLHRLGYGGGYYDRLLAAHPDSLNVGLCYEAGKLQQLPVEQHDIALDMIITEHRAYRA